MLIQENQSSVVAAHAQIRLKLFQVNMSQRYIALALVMQPQLRLRSGASATLGTEGVECEACGKTMRHLGKGR